MAEIETEAPAADAAPTGGSETEAVQPADIDGYQKLVEKLRGENKTLRSDRTPQDERDKSTIAALRRDLKASEPKVAEYDRLTEASKTAEERAQGLAAAAEARASKLLNRAVSAEAKAAATGFADPDDAAAFLDLSKYATSDGDVDTEALKSDLAELLVRKPHLGKATGSRLPAPNPAQGSSASGPVAPGQLSQADVTHMYAQKDYDGITKAQAEGRLSKLMGA